MKPSKMTWFTDFEQRSDGSWQARALGYQGRGSSLPKRSLHCRHHHPDRNAAIVCAEARVASERAAGW